MQSTSAAGHLVKRAIIWAIGAIVLGGAPASAQSLVFHAASSGQQTLDEGEGGGNPFASSLIELLGRPSVFLAELPGAMRDLTARKSQGFQSADVPGQAAPAAWTLVPPAAGERRIALVMVVADYARSGGAQSLPGARHDAERIAAALTRAGFATQTVIDHDVPAMIARLKDFAARSEQADAAVIYTTGHGVEIDGSIYLLPGDYPVAERKRALSTRALRLSEIAGAVRAKVSLVFYGGCRDNPFGE